jgi:hypothetical protein
MAEGEIKRYYFRPQWVRVGWLPSSRTLFVLSKGGILQVSLRGDLTLFYALAIATTGLVGSRLCNFA